MSELTTALSADLAAGRIEVFTDSGAAQAAALFGFAERNNPRRAFLFVSRVLGRHVPVRPGVMRAAFQSLADRIPADAAGPVAITGMAETAVGLGAGVHDSYLARTGRRDVVFLATTRTRFDAPLLAEFSEEHSHASHHLVHLPARASDRALLAQARTLVMVDDETTTGRTFANLAAALAAAGMTRIEAAQVCVLTDWSRGAADGWLCDGRRVPVSRAALLSGSWRWTDRRGAPTRALPDADIRRAAAVTPIRRDDDGRLGRSHRSARALPDGLGAVASATAGRIHVVGTGEHVWEPFLIAEALEALGRDVVFSATTRSPIILGGAIAHGLTFRDHEGLGIANYLYNAVPDPAGRTILCVDTSLDAIDPGLLVALDADVIVGDRFIDRATLAPIRAGADAAQALPPGPPGSDGASAALAGLAGAAV